MSNETENNLEINRQPDPAATLKSARDSVWVINDNLQKLNNGQQFTNDIKGNLERNLGHLKLVVASQYIIDSGLDVSDLNSAITAAETKIAENT